MPAAAGGSPKKPASLQSRLRCTTCIIQKKELAMDFIRRLQARDWTIAAVAFLAGAWIF
jgi:antitoxin component HigA of HigAB toxin-antitoxin module